MAADMRLVPAEPTQEMINTICAIKLRRIRDFSDGKDGQGVEPAIREEYAALRELMPPCEHSFVAFYDEVCRRAEAKMLASGKLEGMHYASMQEVLKEWTR